MSPLKTIARDLLERRLWPVAALLAVGLVAVPVAFKQPSPGALEQSATPAAAPVASTPAPTDPAAAAAAGAAPTDPSADPSVALTSSPFAAAFGGPVNLPPAMEGLLKATKGTDDRKVVEDAPLRDPFAVPGGGQTAAAQTAGASAQPATTRTATASAGAGSGGTTTIASSDTGSSIPAASTTKVAAPVSSDVPAVPDAPASDTPAKDDSWVVYRTDVRFGTTATPPTSSDTKRLTAFPSTMQPVAIFLGVMRGGWGAVFAIRDDARPVGAPSCRPRKTICSWVILHPGESVTLNVKDPATGTVTPYKLELAKIRKDDLSQEAALAANQRASAAGRCLLGPLAAYRYDSETGTLAPRPELKACRYDTAGQGDQAAQPLTDPSQTDTPDPAAADAGASSGAR